MGRKGARKRNLARHRKRVLEKRERVKKMMSPFNQQVANKEGGLVEGEELGLEL